ncbi:Uncharacterised protein [Kingella potus]|uniref:Uncharacterized protein n=2 Tax=Kingella potus TaxID=265175 RepID=A0A377R3D7_9NEIS|nr:hypothetical protein [Kingella potus]STR02724.1 Uncharacterised protein [Kingella potus]
MFSDSAQPSARKNRVRRLGGTPHPNGHITRHAEAMQGVPYSDARVPLRIRNFADRRANAGGRLKNKKHIPPPA